MKAWRAVPLAVLLAIAPLATARGPYRPVTYQPVWRPPNGATIVEFVERYNAGEALAIASAIHESASRHGIEPRLLAAVLCIESKFKPNAVSEAGAIGIAQLMPETAAEPGVNPWRTEECIDGGAAYLAKMLRWNGGSIEAALAAYNAGPNCRDWPPETRAYVRKVLETQEGMKQK